MELADALSSLALASDASFQQIARLMLQLFEVWTAGKAFGRHLNAPLMKRLLSAYLRLKGRSLPSNH